MTQEDGAEQERGLSSAQAQRHLRGCITLHSSKRMAGGQAGRPASKLDWSSRRSVGGQHPAPRGLRSSFGSTSCAISACAGPVLAGARQRRDRPCPACRRLHASTATGGSGAAPSPTWLIRKKSDCGTYGAYLEPVYLREGGGVGACCVRGEPYPVPFETAARPRDRSTACAVLKQDAGGGQPRLPPPPPPAAPAPAQPCPAHCSRHVFWRGGW